ncbi:hypothetical protein [Cohaesibacter gelatinilyticus]|uniref:Uncharacterized protein n=1 Tax=Cohaesibacter gelatinilyticus TaxID=372072 RepID=A0A285PIZ4_9HYPH|nr:hypothetical protein [Cohaesibacter gelatinilyticus]SNZ20096.1 hypothetical protein SAMN06265368_3195 [Cohaesibacter gelatinilyticus]
MMEQHGCRSGFEDGKADAAAGKRQSPRPTIAHSLLSSNYLSAYLISYRKGYAHQIRENREVRKQATVKKEMNALLQKEMGMLRADLQKSRSAERTHYQNRHDHQADLER